MTWAGVDAADVILLAGKTTPTPGSADDVRADLAVAAVNAAVRRLIVTTSAALEAELDRAALLDALDAFRAFDVRNGVLTVGPDGDPVRIGSQLIPASLAAFARYEAPGIG